MPVVPRGIIIAYNRVLEHGHVTCTCRATPCLGRAWLAGWLLVSFDNTTQQYYNDRLLYTSFLFPQPPLGRRASHSPNWSFCLTPKEFTTLLGISPPSPPPPPGIPSSPLSPLFAYLEHCTAISQEFYSSHVAPMIIRGNNFATDEEGPRTHRLSNKFHSLSLARN